MSAIIREGAKLNAAINKMAATGKEYRAIQHQVAVSTIFHAAEHGDARPMTAFFGYLSRGDQAVEVFVILSGFVIALMRLNEEEPYGRYIFRRFMRLYPLFLIALILGAMTMHLYAPVFGSSPSDDDPRARREPHVRAGSGGPGARPRRVDGGRVEGQRTSCAPGARGIVQVDGLERTPSDVPGAGVRSPRPRCTPRRAITGARGWCSA